MSDPRMPYGPNGPIICNRCGLTDSMCQLLGCPMPDEDIPEEDS